MAGFLGFLSAFNMSYPAPIFGVGAPGIGPGLQDPQPCVLPVYYAPRFWCGVYCHSLYYSPLTSFAFIRVNILHALRAGLDTGSRAHAQMNPLEVRVFSLGFGKIVVTAEEHSRAAND